MDGIFFGNFIYYTEEITGDGLKSGFLDTGPMAGKNSTAAAAALFYHGMRVGTRTTGFILLVSDQGWAN